MQYSKYIIMCLLGQHHCNNKIILPSNTVQLFYTVYLLAVVYRETLLKLDRLGLNTDKYWPPLLYCCMLVTALLPRRLGRSKNRY